MRATSICALLVALALCGMVAAAQEGDLAFGQVYGSAGFLSSKPSGTMADAPATVLAFTAADGHRTLVLTNGTGDYIALLAPGRHCVLAYTKAGKALEFAKNQLKCVDMENRKDVRLDIMLLPSRK